MAASEQRADDASHEAVDAGRETADTGGEAADPTSREPAEQTPHEPGFVPHLRRTWRWYLLGLVGAVGLGVFMWAVDGRVNKPAPEPQGVATTPAEAVDKFLAAVDRHDADLARAYAGDALDAHVEDWIDRAGYVRLIAADEAASQAAASEIRAGITTASVDVTYEAVTGFLDDDDPLGLNLAALVWTEKVEHPFVVTRTADGSWVVEDAGPSLRK